MDDARSAADRAGRLFNECLSQCDTSNTGERERMMLEGLAELSSAIGLIAETENEILRRLS